MERDLNDRKNHRVSILVLVDAALRHIHLIHLCAHILVSILVLVDAALRHQDEDLKED